MNEKSVEKSINELREENEKLSNELINAKKLIK
jgi:hypothetical protein